MGKSIKFFKKLTSLVLAGLTIFSSVPAKAWKEEDPRKNIEAEVRYKLQNGYSEITKKDIESYYPIIGEITKDFIGFGKAALSLYIHPIDIIYNGIFGDGIILHYDDKYFAELCKRKEVELGKIVKMSFWQTDSSECPILEQINFPNLINAELYTSNNICFLTDDCNGTTFSKCPNLKLLRVTGNGKIGFLNNNYFNTKKKESIDLFPACKHGVIIICDTEDQFNSFKNIMGDKGKRHKVLLAKDLEKFDEANKKPVRYEVKDSAIVKGNGEDQNIIIPKNVNKIEKYAFKDTGVVGVTFEEGMTEIEFCDGCFAGCPLVKFELPKSLKKITLGNNCFENCNTRVAIEGYIRSEQQRIKNEEIERQRKEEEQRKIEAERKRKEEEERKRKEEEEKMKRKKKELDEWKKETRKKIEDEKAKLEKEIRGDRDRDGDEIFDPNSLMYKKVEVSGVKTQCKNELERFLENHPECITYGDEQNFGNNWANKIHQKLDNKNNNKNNEIDKIRAELISKEDKLLRSKLEVAKLKVELYDEKINSRKSLIKLLDEQLKILDKIEEIKEEFLGCLKLIADLKVKEKAAELKLEEAEKQKEESKKLYSKLMEKERMLEETRKQQEKVEQEQDRKELEQERTDKRQDEKQKKLNERQKKLKEEQQKLKKEKIFWDIVTFLAKSALTLSPLAPFIPVVGPIITSVVQPIITSSVSAVTSIVGLVANLTVDICKSLFTSKSKKEVHQKPSNSASNTSATPV